MNSRRLSTVVVFSLLAFIFLPADAFADDTPGNVGSRMSADYSELWAVQQARRAAHKAGPVNARTKPKRVITYVPACSANEPFGPINQSVLCSAAVGLCGADGAVAYWVYTAPAGPPAPGANDWTPTGQTVCRGGAPDDDAARPGVSVSAEDFRRLPIPAAGLMVQPPNLRTLVNVPTNLYADAKPVILPTTVLGQAVRVRATPATFTWTYGDGQTRTINNAGGPYPDLSTAHTYNQPGQRQLALATTYSGEFSVANGPWLPITGTATVNSPGTTLTVLEARTHLVAGPTPKNIGPDGADSPAARP